MKHLHHLGILQMLTLPPAMWSGMTHPRSQSVGSWGCGKLHHGSLPPAADPLAQTEGDDTAGNRWAPLLPLLSHS